MQDFHNVRAWRKAHRLAIAIRRLVDQFPSGYGNLRRQMIDSAESIADNIAEGCGAATNTEFARFLDISIKSTSELENQLERSHGYKLIRTPKFELYSNEVRTIRKMTWGLRREVLGDADLQPDQPPSASKKSEPKSADGKR